MICNLTPRTPWADGCELCVECCGGVRTSGFPGSVTGYMQLSAVPGFLWASLSSLGRTPFVTDSTSHTHSSDLLELVRVLWIINLGILSSYWPWNISSFTEKLFLKEGCQRPFWGRLRKVSTSALGQSTHLHSPFPSGLRTRTAAHSVELAKDTLSVTALRRRENEQPCV